MTVDELKSINNLKSNLLSIGQRLKIKESDDNQNIYIVKKGDTLYKIANNFNRVFFINWVQIIQNEYISNK